MSLTTKRSLMAILIILIIMTTSCSPSLTGGQKEFVSDARDGRETLPIHSASLPNALSLPLTATGGKAYIAGPDFAGALDYRYRWNAQRNVFQLGVGDASCELTADSTTALRDDETIVLSDPPRLYHSQFYIPVSALAPLFKSDLSYEIKDKEIVFHPVDGRGFDSGAGENEAFGGMELDFADDPADPYKSGDLDAIDQPVLRRVGEKRTAPAAKRIDIDKLIARAKRYVGVSYAFGADPYPLSGQFDSSSFTAYVYDKYNVKLGRTAGAQSKQGVQADRKRLRRGDLLFFYVPGRYRSNQVVGHVGIYLGRQRMIHASPDSGKGVEIVSLNTPYWKKTFLQARRPGNE